MEVFLSSPKPSQQPQLLLHSRFPNPTTSNPHSFRIPVLRWAASSSAPSVQKKPLLLLQLRGAQREEQRGSSDSEELLVARRPAAGVLPSSPDKQVVEKEEAAGKVNNDDLLPESSADSTYSSSAPSSSSGIIDTGLSSLARRMPVFEPAERVAARRPEEQPLGINLELWLYRAKVLARAFRYKDAEAVLNKCIDFWPEDGRAYVALGKFLVKQSRNEEARAVYERGCQATQGENSYIWQCWAVLESKLGNGRRARELFDAATVADSKHVAAWHGWAVLEIREGNVSKARHLLGKGLKYCGGNEYIYQTLALLESKAGRVDRARYLFQKATVCNPKSCASWIAWSQMEVEQENPLVARKLFEKAIQASPKNRFAWHVWALFEASQGDISKARKLLKIGHALNPRDPVLLQSLALLEYRHASANVARRLFRRAAELDPRHQPVWMAWGWMEWKEGSIATARQFYQKTLSIDATTDTAARCLQAWGVLEQRLGNLSAARRLFRSSLNINSQSYVTWMTWASLEEEQGNAVRAEEIRIRYFQQRMEVVDDASWIMGFLDIIDPAVDSIKRLLNLDQNVDIKEQIALGTIKDIRRGSSNDLTEEQSGSSNFQNLESQTIQYSNYPSANSTKDIEESEVANKPIADANGKENYLEKGEFDLDAFVKDKLSLDPSKLDLILDRPNTRRIASPRKKWRPENRKVPAQS